MSHKLLFIDSSKVILEAIIIFKLSEEICGSHFIFLRNLDNIFYETSIISHSFEITQNME